jgi:hypothetical protein
LPTVLIVIATYYIVRCYGKSHTGIDD